MDIQNAPTANNTEQLSQLPSPLIASVATKSSSTTIILVVIASLVVLVVLSIGSYYLYRHFNPSKNTSSSGGSTSDPSAGGSSGDPSSGESRIANNVPGGGDTSGGSSSGSVPPPDITSQTAQSQTQQDASLAKQVLNLKLCKDYTSAFNTTSSTITGQPNPQPADIDAYCDSGLLLMNGKCENSNSVMNTPKFKSTCCNNSTDTGKCNSSARKCTGNSVKFNLQTTNVHGMTPFSISANPSVISDYCDLGASLRADGCATSDLMKNVDYTRLCCNNSTDPAECNSDSLTCLLDNARFTNLNLSVDSMSFSSLVANATGVSEYCDLGATLTSNKCTAFDPTTQSAYNRICCNGSSDPASCTTGALACVIDGSEFSTIDSNMQTFNIRSVALNLDTVAKYCDAGDGLLSNNCKSYDVMKSPQYSKLCCNNSTDASNCGTGALDCAVRGSKFTGLDDSLVGTTVASANSANIDIINKYCEFGIALNNDNCRVVVPQSSTTFTNLCCDGSTNPDDCNSESRACLVNGIKFTAEDYTMTGFSADNADAMAKIGPYCDLGNSLLTSGCSGVNPMASANFKLYCCNNSSDSADCNTKSLGCTRDSISYNMSTTQISSLNKATLSDNISSIIDYCTVGDRLGANSCGRVVPVKQSLFSNLCCNGSTNAADCNTGALTCLLSSQKFNDKDAMMANTRLASFTPSTTSTVNIDNLKSYCDSGVAVNTNKCANSHPMTSTTFTNYCCNKSTLDTDCTTDNLNCTLDGADFLSRDTNISSVTNFSGVNGDALLGYCALGIKLQSKGCKSTIPLESTTFKNFCCNNSSNPRDCSTTALKCTLDQSSFTVQDRDVASFTTSVDVNTVYKYCMTGKSMLSNNCSNNPMDSSTYRYYCCNNSVNPGDCLSSTGGLECLSDRTEFINLSKNLSVLGDAAMAQNYTGNNGLNRYCTIGRQLLDNSCTQITPLSDPLYKKWCCGGSSVSSDCKSTVSQCTDITTRFIASNLAMTGVTVATLPNLNQITDYCSLGSVLTSNGCATNPVSYPQFNKFCCNNSNDPTHCVSGNTGCYNSVSQFLTLDPTVSGMSAQQIVSNTDTVNMYCASGRSVQSQSCSQLNPMNYASYRNLCCNGSTLSTDCNTTNTCAIDSANFTVNNKMVDQYITPSADISGNLTQIITPYCVSGERIQSQSCQGIDPFTTLQYSNLCCGGSHIASDCNATSLGCLVDNTAFATANANLSGFTGATTQNLSSINSYCSLGDNINLRKCNISQSTSPSNKPIYNKYCSKNSTDCQPLISGFLSADASYTPATLSSINSQNTGGLTAYCALGTNIISKGCSMIVPTTSANFTAGCCNSSTVASDCGITGASCTILNGDYLTADRGVSNLVVGVNTISQINSFCSMGSQIIVGGCVAARASVSASANYRHYCCNDSANISTCASANSVCATSSAQWLGLESGLTSNLTPSQIIANITGINNYCSIGESLITNNCAVVNPLSHPIFTGLCCAGSLSALDCKINNTSPCVSDVNNFIVADAGGNPQANDSSGISAYCAMGSRILSNGCRGVNPMLSNKFKSLCCGGSNSVGDCTTSSQQCGIDYNTFHPLDVTVSTAITTPSQILSNIPLINQYCAAGTTLLSETCNVSQNPMGSSQFQKLCCGGGTTASGCTAKAQSCLAQNTSFASDISTSNITGYTATNASIVNAYCDSGLAVYSSGCDKVTVSPPLLSSKYTQLCCGGSSSLLNCRPLSTSVAGTSCATDTGVFTQYDSIVSTITNYSQLLANTGAIATYCAAGVRLLGESCATVSPTTYPNYTRFCLDGITGSVAGVVPTTCLISESNFLASDAIVSTTTVNSGSIASINSYCDIGNSLLTSKCNGANLPIVSNTFLKLCCNNSTNPASCAAAHTPQCATNSTNFLNVDTVMSGVDTTNYQSIASNIPLINSYCTSGLNLLSNNCSVINLAASTKFKTLCCNASSSMAGCTQAAVTCLADTTNFNILDATTTASSDVAVIGQYCSLGNKITQEQCPVTLGARLPMQSLNYTTLCCAGSTDPAQCNVSVQQLSCAADTTTFSAQSYGLTPYNLTTSPATLNAYCDLGVKISTAGCSQINPLTTPLFTGVCCNSSSSSITQCTTGARGCAYNTADFSTQTTTVKNYDISTLNDNLPSINAYCDLGIGMISRGCATSPLTNTTFTSTCCDGQLTAAGCAPKARSCKLGASYFIENRIQAHNTAVNPNNGAHISIPIPIDTWTYPTVIKPYCDAGVAALNQNCTTFNPLTFDTGSTTYTNSFSALCCAGTTDPLVCKNTSVTNNFAYFQLLPQPTTLASTLAYCTTGYSVANAALTSNAAYFKNCGSASPPTLASIHTMFPNLT